MRYAGWCEKPDKDLYCRPLCDGSVGVPLSSEVHLLLEIPGLVLDHWPLFNTLFFSSEAFVLVMSVSTRLCISDSVWTRTGVPMGMHMHLDATVSPLYFPILIEISSHIRPNFR